MIASNVTFFTVTFEAEFLTDRLCEVGVHADHGLAVGVEVLVRRVRGVRRDHERALAT